MTLESVSVQYHRSKGCDHIIHISHMHSARADGSPGGVPQDRPCMNDVQNTEINFRLEAVQLSPWAQCIGPVGEP